MEHQQQQSYGGDDDDDDGGRYFAEGKQIIFERNIHVLWDFIEHIYVYPQSIEWEREREHENVQMRAET